MGRDLPTWSHAQLIVSHGSLTVGVFASTKPWMPRHKEQRFLGVGPVPFDPDESPFGGSPLKPLTDSAHGTIEEHGFVVLAGEAAGLRSVAFTGGGQDWTLVLASDAWVAVGPRDSGPQAIQFTSYVLDLSHLEFGHGGPAATTAGEPATFRIPSGDG
jgi:hypothetical protein